MGHVQTVLRIGLLLCIVALAARSSAQERNRAQELPRYRRVEVPVEATADFIEGLIPRPRQEFERLVDELHQPPRPAYVFAESSYQAELNELTLDQGTAEVTPFPAETRATAQGPRLLPMDGNIALNKPIWRQGEVQRPALVGTGEGSQYVLLDPSANELTFEWTHRGTAVGEAAIFQLRFPAALIYRLELAVPRNRWVSSDHGVITRNASRSNDRDTVILEWSDRQEIQVVIHPDGTKGPAANRSQLTQTTSYLVGPSQVKVQADLQLNAGLEPISTLKLELNSGLTVTHVTRQFEGNSEALPWIVSEQNRLHIELPRRPASMDSQTIRVEAFAPMGTALPLPRLSAVDLEWVSGTSRVRVLDPFVVDDVRFTDCRCLSMTPENDRAETMLFVLDRQDAEITLALRRRIPTTTSEALVALIVDGNSVNADVELRLMPEQGELFEATVPIRSRDGWILDANSVEVDRPDGSPPFVDRIATSTDRIDIQLDRAILPDRPLRIRLRLINDTLPDPVMLHEIAPISLPGGTTWVHVRSAGGLELRPEFAERISQPAGNIPPDQPAWIQRRIQDPSSTVRLAAGDLFFRQDERQQAVRLVKRSMAIPVVVRSFTTVTIEEGDWRQSVRIAVDPMGNEMSEVVALFSRDLPPASNESTSTWKLTSGTGRSVEAEVSPRGSNSDGQRHRIPLPEPLKEPFELRMEFEVPHDYAEIDIPLVTIEGDATQTGSVALFGAHGTTIELVAGELTAVPYVEAGEQLEGQYLHGAYTYHATAAFVPDLLVRPRLEKTTAAIHAWRCDIRSFYSEKGRPRHRVDYLLQNEGALSIDLRVPDGLALEGVEVNGQAISSLPLVNDGQFTLGLPGEQRFPSVSVRYIEPDSSLRSIDWLRRPSDLAQVATLQTTWQVWLPRDYRVYASRSYESQDDDWLSRLVGPFADRSRLPFGDSPLRALVRRFIPGEDDASVVALQMVNLFGTIDPTNDAQSTPMGDTWAAQLALIERGIQRGRPDFQILIDREEFRRLGVTTASKLPTSRFETPRQVGTDRLRQFGLAIMVDGDRAVLTSSSELREFASNADLLFDVAIEGSTDWFAESRLVSRDRWVQDELDELWTLNGDTLEVGLQAAGWKSYRQEVLDVERPLKIYHRDTVVALSCSMFLFGIALGWWCVRAKRRRWLLVMAVAFAAAEMLPQPGATLAVASAWGMLVSGVYRLVTGTPFVVRSFQLPTQSQQLPTRAALLLLSLSFWTWSADSVRGQEAAEVPNEVERVIFPRDGDGTLTDHVYLRSDFHRSLLQRKSQRRKVPGHLLTRATYHATYDPNLDSGANDLVVQVEYAVTTLRPNQRIELPAWGGNVVLDDDTLTLDQQPIEATDESNGTKSIPIERPGDYRLRLVVRQGATVRFGNRRWQIRIPQVAQSSLTFNFPRNATGAQATSALGVTQVDLKRGLLRADLGPTEQLAVEASLDDPAPSGPPQVDQAFLVRFVNGEVRLETRFRFVDGRQPLRLDVDPRWEPLALTEGMSWDATVAELAVDATHDMGVTFTRSWPIPGGRFPLPRIDPQNAKVRSRFVAVALPASTRAELLTSTASSLTRTEFMEVWGGTLDAQVSTFFQTPTMAPLSFGITGAEAVMNWNDATSYFFGHDRVFFRTNLELRPGGNETTKEAVRRLRLPATLQVTDLSATDAFGESLRTRWRRVDDETYVLLFLDQPRVSQTEPLEIVIRGELLRGGQGDLNLPLVTPVAGRNLSESHQILLYAAPNVELRAAPNASLSAALNPDESTDVSGYRFVGSWASNSADSYESGYAFPLSVHSHHRQLTGSLTTRLQNEGDQWIAEATVVLDQAEAGDALFFELPEDLVSSALTATENDVDLRIDEAAPSPAVNRRVVTVWLPPASGTEPRSITLVAAMDQEQTRLPHLKLLNISLQQRNRLAHFIELPNSPEMDDSRFTWNHAGLVEEPNPDGGNYKRYRVARDNYSAILDEVESGSQQAEVYLLDTVVRWTFPDEYLAISTFDLKPAGETICFADLPPGAEILRLFVDERRMFIEPQSNGGRRTQRIPLASQPWPQRVRIFYRGSLSTGYPSDVRLVAPRLLTSYRKPMAILRELWTVYGPNDVGAPRLVDDGDQPQDISERTKQLVVAFTDLWAGVQPSIRERSRDEKSRWLRAWANRLGRILEREQSFVLWDDDDQLRPYHQLVADYQDVFNPIAPPSPPVMEDELWNESQWVGNSMLHCRSAPPEQQALPALRLRYARSQRANQPARTLMGLLMVASAFVLPRLAWTHRLRDHLQQHPYVIGIVIGAAWWWLLSPYWLGAVIGLLVVGAWLSGVARRQRKLLFPPASR